MSIILYVYWKQWYYSTGTWKSLNWNAYKKVFNLYCRYWAKPTCPGVISWVSIYFPNAYYWSILPFARALKHLLIIYFRKPLHSHHYCYLLNEIPTNGNTQQPAQEHFYFYLCSNMMSFFISFNHYVTFKTYMNRNIKLLNMIKNIKVSIFELFLCCSYLSKNIMYANVQWSLRDL